MGPRLAFASTSSVGASATCAMTLPSSLIRRSERGHAGTSSGPADPRPIVNAQQTAVSTFGQGKKDEKGGRFPECNNRRDIYDGQMSESPLGLGELMSHAWKIYRPRAPLMVPTFIVAFVVLRELLLV